MHICRYYHDDILPEDVRRSLEDTLYARLFSPESRDTAGDSSSQEEPIRHTLDRLLTVTDFTRFTRANSRLAERLAHEAVHWVGHRWEEISEQPALDEEAALLATFAGAERDAPPDYQEIADAAKEAQRHRPELSGTAQAVTREPSPAEPDSAAARLDRSARMQLLRNRWNARITAERNQRQSRELGKAIGAFVRELQELVPRLAEKQELVRDALGNEDALWDLSRHQWEEIPLAGLSEATDMLEQHPEIIRIAETVGRSESVTEKRTTRRVENSVAVHYVGQGKSEVTGIRSSDDLTSLLPSEVALLSDPASEELFFAKLARKELLVLDYKQERLVTDVRQRMVSVLEEVLVPRGPVIVCVDTSGSMLGLPEKVAKAVTLALARRLSQDKRRIEVIAFATDVRSFSLDFRETGLPELSQFLAGGFHGGTDLSKALTTSLSVLEQEQTKHADVLVVSDFKVPKIADRHAHRIKRQHQRGTRFHSLTIARSEIIDPLNIFDTAWLFDTGSGRMHADALHSV